MNPIETEMIVHSLGGQLGKGAILRKLGDNDYEAVYNGVHCHAIFNPFVGKYYADDIYGIIPQKKKSRNTPCR